VLFSTYKVDINVRYIYDLTFKTMSRLLDLQHSSFVKLLGHGSQGQVYLLCNNTTGKQYTVKFTLIQDDDYRSEYEHQWMQSKEVLTILIKIQHPNIVRIYEVGDIKVNSRDYKQIITMINSVDVEYSHHSDNINIPYTVMDYIEGYNLNEKHIDDDQAFNILTDLMSALTVFNKYNIYHGDLSFHNVMYNTKTNKYVVIDFDYAEILNSTNYLDYATLDTKFVNDNLLFSIFYPQDSGYSDDNYVHHNYMLPDTTLINKYCNYAVETKGLPLTHYITILSILMGERVIDIELEHEEIESWQYGKKQ